MQGRDINLKTFLTDSFAAVINEAAAKAMSFKNPIGQNLKYDTNYHVIGVVKDFIIESPYETDQAHRSPGAAQPIFQTPFTSNSTMKIPLPKISRVWKKYSNNITRNTHSNTNLLMKHMPRNLPANR